MGVFDKDLSPLVLPLSPNELGLFVSALTGAPDSFHLLGDAA